MVASRGTKSSGPSWPRAARRRSAGEAVLVEPSGRLPHHVSRQTLPKDRRLRAGLPKHAPGNMGCTHEASGPGLGASSRHMQLEAEQCTINVTYSSSTRNLKGRSTAAHMQLLGCRRGTRHTVVASGFAFQAKVLRETGIRATARPHLMRVAPRAHCERESACVPPGSVSIQLHAQVKGRIGSFHVNLLVHDASAPPTRVSAGKESLMPRRARFTGNVGCPKVVRSSRTGFPPLRVCRLKSME